MNRLKKLRSKNNLTLEELGNIIGIGKPSISRYENGTRTPKTEVWQKLAKFFGVSVEYLQGAYSKEEIIDIAIELGLGERFLAVMKYNWDTVPMKWLLEKPELNASEEDVANIIRRYCD